MGHSNEMRLKLFNTIILKLVNFGYLQTLHFWQVHLSPLSSTGNIKPLLTPALPPEVQHFSLVTFSLDNRFLNGGLEDRIW